jgi:hypothetical protein
MSVAAMLIGADFSQGEVRAALRLFEHGKLPEEEDVGRGDRYLGRLWANSRATSRYDPLNDPNYVKEQEKEADEEANHGSVHPTAGPAPGGGPPHPPPAEPDDPPPPPDPSPPEPPQPEGPRPLRRELPPPPPFPLHAFGCVPVLQQAVKAINAATQAPISIAGNSVLGACSLCVQPHVDVLMPYGAARPTSLFLGTVAESGERKNSVDELATAAKFANGKTNCARPTGPSIRTICTTSTPTMRTRPICSRA